MIHDSVVQFPVPDPRVRPRQDSGRVGPHRYVLTYQPDARIEARRWLWRVYFSVELQYHGYAATPELARVLAQRRLTELMEDRGA